jgi:hypothetical protein
MKKDEKIPKHMPYTLDQSDSYLPGGVPSLSILQSYWALGQARAPARGRAELIPTSSPADLAPRVDATQILRSTLAGRSCPGCSPTREKQIIQPNA